MQGDLEQQQQPTAVVPGQTGGDQYQVGGSTSGNDLAASPTAWIKTPVGILRLVEWLFAIISFGCMADSFDFTGFKWSDFSQFQFLVAVGVLVFLYTLTLIVVYIFRARIERSCLYLPVIELALDGIFCVLLLAAGAAAAAKANSSNYNGSGRSILQLLDAGGYSKAKRNIEASIVFTFFNLLCFIVSTFLSYRANAAEEAKR